MPDEIDRLNETAEDRATGRDFTAAARSSSGLPDVVLEHLTSDLGEVAKAQAAAHQLALRSGMGVLAAMSARPEGDQTTVHVSFEVTPAVPRGEIRWKPNHGLRFQGWPAAGA